MPETRHLPLIPLNRFFARYKFVTYLFDVFSAKIGARASAAEKWSTQ